MVRFEHRVKLYVELSSVEHIGRGNVEDRLLRLRACAQQNSEDKTKDRKVKYDLSHLYTACLVVNILELMLPGIFLQADCLVSGICLVEAMCREAEQNERRTNEHCANRVEARARYDQFAEAQETDHEANES